MDSGGGVDAAAAPPRLGGETAISDQAAQMAGTTGPQAAKIGAAQGALREN